MRDRSIKEIEADYQLLKEEHIKAIKENNQLMKKVNWEIDEKTLKSSERRHNDKQYIALRNRTTSSEKKHELINLPIKQNQRFQH